MNSQQSDYGGGNSDFAKVILNLQKLLDNSILIETHTDKARGTKKQNLELKQVYVLLGAFAEKGFITPVQFEIKQYVNDDNRLYLAVALTKEELPDVESKKTETGVVDNAYLDKNQESTSLLPVSEISISDLFKKINHADKNFLKYVPNQFLNNKQNEFLTAEQISARKTGPKHTICD